MKTKEIKITNGAFCSGNCSDCLYANFRDTDSWQSKMQRRLWRIQQSSGQKRLLSLGKKIIMGFYDGKGYYRDKFSGGYDAKGYWRNCGEGGFDYQGIWRYSGEGGYDGMGVYRSPGEGGYDSKGIFRDGFEGWSVICT